MFWQSHFSVSHGRDYEVKQHGTCEPHKKRGLKRDDCQADKLTAAEITIIWLTVQHFQSHRSPVCGTKVTLVTFTDLRSGHREAQVGQQKQPKCAF